MRLLERVASIVGTAGLVGCATPGPEAGTTAPAASARAAGAASAAATGGTMKSTESADARFAAFAARFLAEYLERNPTRATEAGDHRYDARWPDLSAEGEAAERRFIEARQKELAAIPEAELGAQRRVDRGVIENQLATGSSRSTSCKEGENEPALVHRGSSATASTRWSRATSRPSRSGMKSLAARLEGVPDDRRGREEAARQAARGSTPRRRSSRTRASSRSASTTSPSSFAKVPAQKAELEAAAKARGRRAHATSRPSSRRTSCRGATAPSASGASASRRSSASSSTTPSTSTPSPTGARDLLHEDAGRDGRHGEGALARADEARAAAAHRPRPRSSAPLVRQVLDKLADDHPDERDHRRGGEAAWLDEATRFVQEHDLVRRAGRSRAA